MNILKQKILSFVLVFCMLLTIIPAVSVGAGEMLLSEDFEAYTTKTVLKNEGYIVWHGATVADSGDNKYLVLNRTDTGMDSQIAKEFSAEPDKNKVIVSLDFMMPETTDGYDVWLFGVLNDSDRAKAVSNILLKDGVLYDGASGDSSSVVRSDLKADKWYHAFVLVDLENDTYTLYCGDYESGVKDFQSKKSYTKTNIFFNVRVKSMETPLYIDNVEVVALEDEALETAIYTAKTLSSDCEIGYENGQYPKTAYKMFSEAYDKIKSDYEKGSIADTDAAAAELNAAIERLKNSKIDESGSDGEARYIVFETPDEIAVGESDVRKELSLKVYDRTNSLVDIPVEWSIEKGCEGVLVDGSTLVIAANTRGSVTLKAQAGDVYDFFTVSFIDGRKVQKLSVNGADGEIKISGSLSGVPLEKVNVTVKGESINITDTLEILPDASFEWTGSVDSDAAFQFIDATIEGNDVTAYTVSVPYYGIGWEEKLLEELNASQEDVKKLVETYYEGLGVDLEFYYENQAEYDKAISAGIPYESIEAFGNALKNFECILSFDNLTNENIKAVMADNMELLEANGFDKSAYESLDADRLFIFYASAMNIEVDVDKTAVSDIVEELNKIIDNLNAPVENGASGAVTPIHRDDFEGYEKGGSVAGGGYITGWGGTSAEGDDINKYLQLLREEESRARTALEFDEEPDADAVIVSWDFMMPEDVSKYNADVMSVLSDNGNSPSAYIHLENGVLYDGKTTSSNKIMTDLKKGKWYNAFLYVDLVNDKYTLYADDAESPTNNFNKAVTVGTDIFFNAEMYTYGTALYIDNLDISAVKHQNLAIALYKAQSIMKNSTIGYENGQYPETAYNMLNNTYTAMAAASADKSMTAEQADVYADAVNEAIEKFKKNKIGAGTTGKASYIVFDMPASLGVDAKAGLSYDLSAKVYDSKGNEIKGDGKWSLAYSSAGVSVSGEKLVAAPGVMADITVRYETDGIYDSHKIKLTDCKTVDKIDIDSRGAKFNIKGKLNKCPLENTIIKISGNGINIEDVLPIKEDGSFTFEKDIDASLPFGFISVSWDGNDTEQGSCEVSFYGVGWENAVLEKINAAGSSDIMKSTVSTYYIGVDIDFDEFTKYSEVYGKRIYAKKPYASFSAYVDKVRELQCVIDFFEATRVNITEVISAHSDALIKNGFDKAGFESLTEEQKIGLYASATAIGVSADTTKVSEIASKLNEMVASIKESGENKKPSGGGGGAGGGGGGGGFNVNLVEDTKKKEDTAQTEEAPTVEPFKDAHLALWANDALLFVRSKGIMVGDGTNVRPVDAITRGEFAKILSLAFELSMTSSPAEFSDAGDAWWKEYAQIMISNGVMNGIENGIFGGDTHITRQMLAVAVDRVLTSKGIELYDQNDGVTFSDEDAIAPYAKDAVKRLAKKGIVSGIGNGFFAPDVPVKRAEAAQIIYNVLNVK